MVSLGPLGRSRHCTYRCPFCYVNSSAYPGYENLTIDRISEWLTRHRSSYDIVYISGDTDSFAPPREEKGTELVEAAAQQRCDVLFTTRAPLSEKSVSRLTALAARMRDEGNLLIACISLSQLSVPEIEPVPIPPPLSRLVLLRKLRDAGLVAALTIRPMLPQIPPKDYLRILELGSECADMIIGGDFFADSSGAIESALSGLPTYESDWEVSVEQMYFDNNIEDWKVYRSASLQRLLTDAAHSTSTPFFWSSYPALDWLESRRAFFLSRTLPTSRSTKFPLPVIVLDVDGTLYSPESGLMQEIDRRVLGVLKEVTGLSGAAAQDEYNRLIEVYGLVLVGLAHEYGIDLSSSLANVHNFDYSVYFSYSPHIAAKLFEIKNFKVAFSNAPRNHVEAILAHLQIGDYVDAIVTIEDFARSPKPDISAFSRLAKRVGVGCGDMIFFDDNIENVMAAKRLGARAVLLVGEKAPLVNIPNDVMVFSDLFVALNHYFP